MVIRVHRLPDPHACSPIHGFVTFSSVRGEGLRERMLEQEVHRLKQWQRRRSAAVLWRPT